MKNEQITPKQAIKQRKSVRRIPLKSLEALTPDEVNVGNRLLELMPAPVPGERLLEGLADEIEKLIGAEHDVFFHTLRAYPGNELGGRFDECFVTTFRLAPDPEMGLLVADMNLVGYWLEELLEDEPPEARTLPPPSERDFGLVTFVLMQLVNWLCGRGLPPISIPTAPPDLETVKRRMRRQHEIAEAVFAVTTKRSAGLVRLLLPGELIRSMEVFVAKAKRRDRRRQRLMRTRLGELRARLPVTIATLALRRSEWRRLAPGDLLLPDEHGLVADDVEDPSGDARLALDRAGKSHLPCTVRPGDGVWSIEITDDRPIVREEEKKRGDDMSQDQASTDKSQGIDSGMLDRAEVDVQMRVGSLPLPVSVLAQLQSGHVLELDRRVDDGIDLVVDGKVVGKGELVNVEGRLGVRVLSVED